MTRGLKTKKPQRFGHTYGKYNKRPLRVLHIHHNTTINLTVNNVNITLNNTNGSSSSHLDPFDKLKAGPICKQVLMSSGHEFLLRQETLSSFDSDGIESSHSSLKIFKDSYGHSSKDYSSGNLPSTFPYRIQNTVKGVKKRKRLVPYKVAKKQLKYKQTNTSKIERTLSAASSTPNRPHIIPSPNTVLDHVISPIFGLDINAFNEDVFEPENNNKPEDPEMKTAGMSGLLGAFDKLDLSMSTHPCENKENSKPIIGTNSSPDKRTPKSRKPSICSTEEINQEFNTPVTINSKLKRSESRKKNPLSINHSDENLSAYLGFDSKEFKSKCGQNNVINQSNQLNHSDENLSAFLGFDSKEFKSKCGQNNVINQSNQLNHSDENLSAFLGFDSKEFKSKHGQNNTINQSRSTMNGELNSDISLITDQHLNTHNSRLSLQAGKQWRRSMLTFKLKTGVRKNTIGPDVIAQLIKDANNIDTVLNRSHRGSFVDRSSQIRHNAKESGDFSITNRDIFKHVSVRKRHEVLGRESFYCFNANLMAQIEEEDSCKANDKSDTSTNKEEDNIGSLDKTPSVKPKISYNMIINKDLDKVNNVVDMPEISLTPPNEVFKYSEDHIDKLECTKNIKSTDFIQEFCRDQCDLDETSVSKCESFSTSLNNDKSITAENSFGKPRCTKGSSSSDYDVDGVISEDSPGIVQSRFTSICYSPLMFDDGDNEDYDEDQISGESYDDEHLGLANPALHQTFEGDNEDYDEDQISGESYDDEHLGLANPALHQTFEGHTDDNIEDYDEEEYDYNDGEHKISEESYDDHHLGLANPALPQAFDDEGQLLEAIIQMDEREWGELAVLSRCGLTAPLRFKKAFPKKILKNSCKLGEGVYSEVFMIERPEGQTVLKIIPVEGQQIVNNAVQKKFYEILSELIITDELSSLRNNTDHCTTAFCELKNKFCVIGKYPKTLLELWHKFSKEKKTYNDCPDLFESDQLYVAMELAHSGTAVEDFHFTSAAESYSVFLQIVLALAVAETLLEFEHRDLHIGNILLRTTDEEFIHFKLDRHNYFVPSFGVQATIIDFTLSRLSLKGKELYFDLAQDPEMFEGDANEDLQFEVYRQMRNDVNGNWQKYEPKTNVRWLDYLITKLIKSKYKKNKKNKEHKTYSSKLIRLQHVINNFSCCYDLAEFLLNAYPDSLELIKSQ